MNNDTFIDITHKSVREVILAKVLALLRSSGWVFNGNDNNDGISTFINKQYPEAIDVCTDNISLVKDSTTFLKLPLDHRVLLGAMLALNLISLKNKELTENGQ